MSDASPPAPSPRPRKGRRRLGDVLVEQETITKEQLSVALAAQGEGTTDGGLRRRLGQILVEKGVLSDRALAGALATALGYEAVDLATEPVDPTVVRLLPRAVAQRHNVVPLSRTDSGLRIAVADPTDVVAVDDVRIYTRTSAIEIVVAPESQIRDLLARAWSLTEDSSDVTTMLEGLDEDDLDEADTASTDNAPTVRLVNVIIADALRTGASDIHIEPQQGDLRIRYRVDGVLREVMTLPRAATPALVSRIKVLGNLDIAERRVPQDGRARLQVEGVVLDTRVSTLPSIHGEKVVVRLLSQAERVPDLDELGLDKGQLETLVGALASPSGLVLITGPTGSGKTNTLYSAISHIRSPEINVVTLEDPVEIQLPGITQVQVHDRAGLSFARGLRSVLRQDPDVILVGEVRDQETAKLALEASLTGHLVLTTLHTQRAPSALTRLVEMGVEAYLVASSLSLVVAQRLVRRVCQNCVESYAPAPKTLDLLGLSPADLEDATPRRGHGCAECSGTGYRGRTGVFEVLPVTAALRHLLLTNPNEAAIEEAAREASMLSLRNHAIHKACAGITTFEEVLRVTSGHAVVGRYNGESPAPTGPRPRILLVDDDPAIRAYVAVALVDSVDVDAVSCGADALTAAEQGGYDAVVIDQRLPDTSGTELIQLFRADARTARLPLMMLTGFDEPDVAAAARAAGAWDVLLKPIEPLALEERVLALLAAGVTR